MKATVWVWESESFWSRALRIQWGPWCEISCLEPHTDSVSFQEAFPKQRVPGNYLAVEYSRKILAELFSLFDKIPSKLENLSLILLDAPRSLHSQSLLREFGFTVFLNDLSSLDAFRNLSQTDSSGLDGRSSQGFRSEMHQRIPLPKQIEL